MKMNLIILFVLAMMACDNNASNYRPETSYAKLGMEAMPEGELMEEDGSNTVQNLTTNNEVERKLIKEGSMSFQCENVEETKVEVERICQQMGAYSSSEGQDSYGENLNYRHTIRVPAEKFDALVQELEKLAIKVESKDINTTDVTEEFIDVETRLKTKKELEARYLEILKQARSVEEVLSVEREIGNVRSEIESMEGRLNYLKNKVAFSTLNVNYYQKIVSDFGFGSKFIQSFSNGWRNLLSFLIGLMSLWPFILLIGVGAWLLIKRRNRKKAA